MKDRKVLVDTSAWIVGFKGTGSEKLKVFLRDIIDRNLAVITPFILFELLQGCKTKKEFDYLKERLECLDIYYLQDLSWEKAYRFGFYLRRKGLTIPTVDILIAFICIEKGYTLFHHDRHFRMIAKHSELEAIDFLDGHDPM